MGTRTRTRPDESRKPGRITAEGYRALQEEAARLWAIDRPRVTEGVATAAAEGDRSENAEYTYGKMKLAAIDRKLRFLGNRLEVLTVVTEPPPDDGCVHFGCWVELEDEDGGRRRYRIVGADETDMERGHISAESPMGKALLGRALDDEVLVKRPKGDAYYVITAVSISDPRPAGDGGV
jgi:transcription elongation factor GreB